MSASTRPQLARARDVVCEVLGAIATPITLQGHIYTAYPCCDAPKHALAWAVAEAEVAREVWNTMHARGVIPASWRDASARSFACPVCARARRHASHHPNDWRVRSVSDCPLCRGAALAAPATCADCVAFASDPEGVAQAEAQVIELAAALSPWGARPPEAFVWRVRAAPRAVRPAPLRRAFEAAALALRKPGEPPPSISTGDEGRTAWRAAVAAGHTVGARNGGAPAPTGFTVAALPDPFVSLGALAALGYTLEALTERDALLCAPPASLDGPGFGAHVRIHDRGHTRLGARRHPH
ncbi:MAG: hypothetical protein U0325_26030 [Polyangiales bacterium]